MQILCINVLDRVGVIILISVVREIKRQNNYVLVFAMFYNNNRNSSTATLHS